MSTPVDPHLAGLSGPPRVSIVFLWNEKIKVLSLKHPNIFKTTQPSPVCVAFSQMFRCGVLPVSNEGKGEAFGELSDAVGAKVKERSENWQHWWSSHCVIWAWQTVESQGGSPPYTSFRKTLHQAMSRGHPLSQPSSDTDMNRKNRP